MQIQQVFAGNVKRSLTSAAGKNKITIFWVSGHIGVEGNEQADKLEVENGLLHFSWDWTNM